jgi:hypothetical protein
VRSILISAAAAAALVSGGCGDSEQPQTPVACLAPASAYLSALEDAPNPVTLADGTKISGCVVREQPPGPLAEVGRSVIGAATRLNADARGHSAASDAAVELGYLVGAVQEGAASTGGIHEDLKRRLDAAARFVPGGELPPLSFERAFGTGYAAGQATG